MKKIPPRPAPRTRRQALKLALMLGGAAIGLPGCGGGSVPMPTAGGMAYDERRHATGGVDSGGTGGMRSFFSVALQGVAPLAAGGVGFDTQTCIFVDADGQPTNAAALAAGMTVWIDATAVTLVDDQPAAAALHLKLAEQIVGPVESLDLAAGTVTVLGQTVAIGLDTLVDPALAADWSQLAPGTRIRVWGQLDSVRRRTVATRLDRPVDDSVDLVRGVLTRLDAATGLLGVGALQAAAGSGAALPGDVALGEVVRLRLDARTQLPQWQAVRLDPLPLPDRETVELEGRVTSVESPSRFALDGLPVDASGLSGGGVSLVPGQRVYVEGTSHGGVLLARQVELQADESDAVVELHGVVQSVDAGASRFTMRRTTVQWNEATRFEGGPASALRARRRVELKGRRSGGGVIEAFVVHLEL